MGTVSAIDYGVMPSPIGLSVFAIEVVLVVASREVVGRINIGTPWLVGVGAAVPSAAAPSKEVYPSVVCRRDVSVGITDIVILIFCETPCVCGSLVLQITVTEKYLLAIAHGKYGWQGSFTYVRVITIQH